MRTPNKTVVLLALAGAAVFFELGRMPVTTANEGQRALPPVEMVRSGNYIIPTTSGEPYLAKPPLLYWAIAVIYYLGGVSEWSARLPTALAGVGLVLLLYLLGRRHIGASAAWWAAAVLLASPYFLERARWANIDVPFTLAVFLSLMALWSSGRAGGMDRGLRLFGGGIAFGAALLLKGPPAMVFLAAAWLALMLSDAPQRDAALRRGIRGTAGLLVLHVAVWGIAQAAPAAAGQALSSVSHEAGFALLALLWVGLAFGYGRQRLRHGAAAAAIAGLGLLLALSWGLAVVRALGWDYILALLDTEVVERTHAATAINSGSPFFYFYNLAFMIAPWGFLLPLHASRGLWRGRPALAQFGILAGWLAVVVFSFFAGKEREYILPAIPLLLLATGGDLADLSRRTLHGWKAAWGIWWRRILAGIVIPAALGVPAFYAVMLPGILPRVEAAALLIASVFLAVRYFRPRRRQLTCFYLLALVAVVAALVGRSHVYAVSSRHNFGYLGTACAQLIERGWTVETFRRSGSTQPCPLPQLVFYVGQPLTLRAENEMGKIVEKIKGAAPYAVVLPERYAARLMEAHEDDGAKLLDMPLTYKYLGIVGNRPLPDDILTRGEQAGRPRRDPCGPGEESPNSTGQDAS